MSKGKIHHIKMVDVKKDNTSTRQQFKTYKLAKSPNEKVATSVSISDLERMRKIANLNYAGIDNETILKEFIKRVLDGR